VRLEGQDDDVDFADCLRVVSRFGFDLKVADFAADAHAVLLHRPEVGATRHQRYVFAGARQHCANKCADCSGPNNRKFHK
jgi:hypothetical protein